MNISRKLLGHINSTVQKLTPTVDDWLTLSIHVILSIQYTSLSSHLNLLVAMQQHLSDCWQSARLWMVVVQSSQQQRCCATSNRRQLVIFTAIQCTSAMTKYCTKNISCYNKKFWDWKVFQKHILTTAETYDTNNTVHQQHLAYFHKITAVSILNTFQHHAHPCLQAHMCQPTGLLQHCRAFDPLPFMTSPMTWMDLSRNQAGSP